MYLSLMGKCGFLVIDSLEILNDYITMIWNIRKDDFLYDLKRLRKGEHPASDIAVLCKTVADMKHTDVWAEFERLKRIQYKQMSDMVREGKTLYVNPAGGYTVFVDNIMNRYESRQLQWPVFQKEDIRIKKWPGGMHYYAYIGPVQVKDGSILKWENESDAETAAMAYVDNKKKLK